MTYENKAYPFRWHGPAFTGPGGGAERPPADRPAHRKPTGTHGFQTVGQKKVYPDQRFSWNCNLKVETFYAANFCFD
ncbi:hypothetical protein, partial [Sphingobacterium multivorum]|uniref:hypothetical protein n=1 Tax=Sphingobacterium multivorum TaxID=28454 RepID=UPI002FDC9186